jgi:hypothetical protein
MALLALSNSSKFIKIPPVISPMMIYGGKNSRGEFSLRRYPAYHH